jgi:hypothetical protein
MSFLVNDIIEIHEDDENYSPSPVGNIIFPKEPYSSSVTRDPQNSYLFDVIVVGLKNQPQLNGRIGIVGQTLPNGRVQVLLYHPQKYGTVVADEKHGIISIKPENIRRFHVNPGYAYFLNERSLKESALVAARVFTTEGALDRLTKLVMDFTVTAVQHGEYLVYKQTIENEAVANVEERRLSLINSHHILALRALTDYLNETFGILCLKQPTSGDEEVPLFTDSSDKMKGKKSARMSSTTSLAPATPPA